jgi:hypothetical protein
MRSARVGCLCLAALVPSTSHADGLPRLVPGAGIDVPVVVRLKSPPSFVLAEPADVVLEWETGKASSVTLPGGITTPCASSPCVLPVAPPGAYRIEPDKDAPTRVLLRALALPKAQQLALGGKIDLAPARAAADDPRGDLADARLHVEAAGRVILDLSPMTTAAHYRPEMLFGLVKLGVHGSAGTPMTQMSISTEVHAAVQMSFDAEPGDYRLRASGIALHVSARPLAATRGTATHAEPQPAAPESVPRLAVGAVLAIEVARAQAVSSTWFTIPGGFDLAIEWTPADVALGLVRANEERLCERSPCIVSRARAGIVAISAFPTTEPREAKVHARLLAQVQPQAPIAVGKASNIETRLPTADDPRGAMAEVVCDVRAPGSYEVTAQDLGRVATNEAAATRLPKLVVVTETKLEWDGTFTTLIEGRDLQDGIGRAHFELATSARVLVRIDGNGDAPPRKLRVACRKR